MDFAVSVFTVSEYITVSFLNISLLSAFIPTFFVVSITPGMCMTLALSLGITVGVRRAMWMMTGELLGVGIVAATSAVGVATFMLQYPTAFELFKYAGGAYLIWLGIQMWRSRGKMAMPEVGAEPVTASRWELAAQGFVTAIANPKGWAFFIALLPPFIDSSLPMTPQLVALVLIILTLEFLCLQLYAHGGRTLRRVLSKGGSVRVANRISGSLMVLVGVWLALG
ncbi:LysE family translocator [Marinobacter sp. AC-23]|uniref:LysE family translocator n=1 Tax=Marinobacter sp. AC-23 TaxID=1879031 RepID=UPI000AFF2F09|nr:LysE family translocator [Marinobacter sp. AC-23]